MSKERKQSTEAGFPSKVCPECRLTAVTAIKSRIIHIATPGKPARVGVAPSSLLTVASPNCPAVRDTS